MSATPAPGVLAAPGVRRFSREDIVRLGQAGRPWEFLPVALQALAKAPGDAGLRVLAATNLVQLGLVTLAREQMGALPPEVSRDAALVGLHTMIAEGAEDRVSAATVVETCRGNVARLVERGVDLRVEMGGFEAELSAWDWFRAKDGNIVRRKGGVWLGIGDHAGFAARFAAEKLTPADPKAAVFTVEGVDPPWMLERVAAATPRRGDGFWTRLVVVQEDVAEFLFGVAQVDLPALGDERTSVFVGMGAASRVEAWAKGRAECKLSGPFIAIMSLRKRSEPGVARALMAAASGQEEEHERLVEEVGEIYRGRDKAWWGARYREAMASAKSTDLSAEPERSVARLRVLVPTSRFSTFIKHSARDLIEALTRMGCEAQMLVEPDDCSQLSSIAWLRTLRDFKPDLVLLINHMRCGLGEWMPRQVPFVTWLQDAMPHQFDSSTGREQGELDFLVGHLHEEMFERFGFPRERTLAAPVVASGVKFHDGPCDAGLLEKYACELALVSHHGESPRRMHERLVGEAGAETTAASAMEAMWPRLTGLVERFGGDPMGVSLHAGVAAISEEQTTRHVGSAGDRARTLLLKTYAMPVADRLLRHQTVAWAAELARERGWRLRLYGRGWEASEELREFAKPEVGHGEELRACYRAAAAHLHVSIHALGHQRVMECALSGGLPVCRMVPELVLRPLRLRAAWAAAVRGEAVTEDATRGLDGFAWTDQPQSAAYVGMLQRLGLAVEPVLWVSKRKRESWRARPEWRPPEPERGAWLLGDVGETTFASRERLGELVAAAVERGEWRAGWSRAIARRVGERYTHDHFVRGVLALVSGELGMETFPVDTECTMTRVNVDVADPVAGDPVACAPGSERQDVAPRRVSDIVPRVVSLIAPHGVSGVSSAMARLASLGEPHYPWRVLAIGPAPIASGDLPGTLTPGFSTLSWAPGTRPVEQVRAVRDRLRAMGATVVSPNFLVQGFVAAALDRHRGVRVAGLFHGSELAAEDLYQRVAPLCDSWRGVSSVIAERVGRYVSPALAGAAAPLKPPVARKADTPRPVPPALATGTEIPERWTRLPCVQSRHEPLRLLYAGWLDERVKRVMDLVRLADALHAEGVDFRLTIAGRGPAAGKLASALAGHIVGGRVLLAGPVPHRMMDELYRGHDVLVLVSQMEGTPTVVMEAMARARPVALTSGCGGALEAVHDGAEGVVVDVGDMHTLARKIASLNGRRGDLARMGERARLAAVEAFDIRGIAARFDALVDEAAASEDGPAADDAPAIARLWSRVLPAMEYLGESTPGELCGLILEWLADLGANAVLHVTEAVEGLGGVLGSGGPVVTAVADAHRAGKWMGWPVVAPGEVADGSLVITASPDEAARVFGKRMHLLPLVTPKMANFASRRVLAALDELRGLGCTRVMLYGAGKHTRKVVAALERATEIVGMVDDRAGERDGPPARLWGFPVVSPAQAETLGFDAVIVSSDEHERAMWPRAKEWAGERPVVALYAPIERPGGEIPEALIATSPRV